jgi:hypothetical protein
VLPCVGTLDFLLYSVSGSLCVCLVVIPALLCCGCSSPYNSTPKAHPLQDPRRNCSFYQVTRSTPPAPPASPSPPITSRCYCSFPHTTHWQSHTSLRVYLSNRVALQAFHPPRVSRLHRFDHARTQSTDTRT